MAEDEAKEPVADVPPEGESTGASSPVVGEPLPGTPAAGERAAAEPTTATPSAPDREPASAPVSTGAKSAEPQSTLSGYRPSYVFLVVVTVVNLVADLWSKHWAKSHFESVKPGDSRRVVVVEDLMNFIFAKNRGGAWGLLQDETEALRRPFFLIVSVAAIVFIVSLYRKLQEGQTALKWGLPLVLGGALGNLVDRIRYGYVVDFIDIYGTLPEWVSSLGMKPGLRHWPTFNVADISICVGVALMAIDMFTSRTPSPKSERKPAVAPRAADDEIGPGTSAASTSGANTSPANTSPVGASSAAAAGDASERA